jgi:hypothetical protein
MKKIVTLVVMATALSGTIHAQFSVGMHLGASSKNAIAGLHTQYQFKNHFTAGINITTHTDNSNPAYLQSRFGYSIGNTNKFSAQPYIGYSYGIQSVDKGERSGEFTKGIQLRYQITRIALVYADFNNPAPQLTMFSIGIAGRL